MNELQFPRAEARVELSSGYYAHRRQAENILDVLGDIGGLHDILSIAFSFLLSFYGTLAFKSHIASHNEVDHS